MAELLKKLCNEIGVSGNDRRIRSLIINEVKRYADEITVDSIGNLIIHKRGRVGEKKIMAAAHMDEPGFIVSGITDKGYIKFNSVGTIDLRTIISKRVVIGDGKLDGVIGMKAIHLQKKSDRENAVSVSDLFIDIGAEDKKEAQKRVAIGDYISFNTSFGVLGENIKGKALDSRIGCYCLAECLKRDYESDFYAVFTAQHEIGGRGAAVAAYNINPDIALVLGSVEAADMFKTKEHERNAVLGGGAVASYMDGGVISDRAAQNRLLELAADIPVQLKVPSAAMSDGGTIQTACGGAAVITVDVPCRYSHSPVCIASMRDVESMTELTNLFLRNGDKI
ncbi:MAG: M42 family peptidase [Oscillospiraceae bacterium]|nr:M42 family peptidase [Oscillospiraceae bacterium]